MSKNESADVAWKMALSEYVFGKCFSNSEDGQPVADHADIRLCCKQAFEPAIVLCCWFNLGRLLPRRYVCESCHFCVFQ